MIRGPFSVLLRLAMGMLWATMGCGFSGPSLGQVGAEQAATPLSAADGYPLRLSTELSGSRGRSNETPVSRGLASKPDGPMRTDRARGGSLPLKPDFDAEVDPSAPTIGRRFMLPPGELNTTGVVRAGRMSIQDGVPILQRDGGTPSRPARLAEGEFLNN